MITAHILPIFLLSMMSGVSNRLTLNLNRKWSASSKWGLSQNRGLVIASPAEWWHHFLKRHMLVTSKLKSSLMLFIFKCSLLDRQHLVWHASQGRPWRSALHGSITRRQPFCADTKVVGLTRDLLWNLSQSCTTRKKKYKCTQLLVYTHPDLSHCLSPTSASAIMRENVRPSSLREKVH